MNSATPEDTVLYVLSNLLKLFRQYVKFIFICAVGGMTALTRSPIGEIMEYEGTKNMIRSMMKEVYDVSNVKGIDLPLGTDQDRFDFIQEQDPSSKGSLCHDLEAGKKTEIDSLCGIVSKLGKEYGILNYVNIKSILKEQCCLVNVLKLVVLTTQKV